MSEATFAAVAWLDCGVNYGASGSPVFQGEGGERRLVAVVSAMSTDLAAGRPVTVAVRLGSWMPRLLEALAERAVEEE